MHACAQIWQPVQVAVFTVLQLPHPSPVQPYIKGLLDPCTNSMTTPNIPAEKLYDKKVRVANPKASANSLCEGTSDLTPPILLRSSTSLAPFAGTSTAVNDTKQSSTLHSPPKPSQQLI